MGLVAVKERPAQKTPQKQAGGRMPDLIMGGKPKGFRPDNSGMPHYF
jgi:hypothetical protein